MPKANLDRRERMAQQTRGEILTAARRLFAERGYAATSINDIAQEADVAVQTIYARLGSKRGMLVALIDLIDEEAGVEQLVEHVQSASTSPKALSAGVHLTRVFQERCGDIIGALFSAAGAEPELATARERESPSTGSSTSTDSVTTSTPNAPRPSSRSAPVTKRGANSPRATSSTGTKPKPGSQPP
jgi:AcrR family transcriptional regulator